MTVADSDHVADPDASCPPNTRRLAPDAAPVELALAEPVGQACARVGAEQCARDVLRHERAQAAVEQASNHLSLAVARVARGGRFELVVGIHAKELERPAQLAWHVAHKVVEDDDVDPMSTELVEPAPEGVHELCAPAVDRTQGICCAWQADASGALFIGGDSLLKVAYRLVAL